MPTYTYAAMDANGKERRGSVDAQSEHDAGHKLRELGLFPTSIARGRDERTGPTAPSRRKPKRTGAGAGLILGTPRLKRKALTQFTRQLAILLRAGLPLLRALRTLESQVGDVGGRTVIVDVGDNVEGGLTFSEALSAHPKTFDRLYINMVKAGEASGAMEQVLARIAGYREKSERLRGRIKSALTYPVMVLAIALLITTGLLYFVVPRFTRMFADLTAGRSLPLITRMVVAVSDAIRHHGLWVLLGAVALFVCFNLIRRTEWGRYTIDLVCLRMPPFGPLVMKSSVARFSATLGTLMNAGVSVLNALQIVRDTSGNAVIANAVQRVHDSVKEGESMARPLKECRIFPNMVVSMIQVGEESGELPEMLEEVATVYEEEVDLAVDAMTSLIEPIMIVGLGLLIGSIVLAMFMPLIVVVSEMAGGM